jgi:hypothetical protein
MYENELMNKKDLAEYYDKKVHALLRDKDMLISKYEQKIKSLSQNTLPSNSNHDSSTSISPRRSSPLLNR